MMKDNEITLGQIREAVDQFIASRNWQDKQDLKSVATSVVLESAELLDRFQWTQTPEEAQRKMTDEDFRRKVSEEMGDILFYLADFANISGISLAEAFYSKLQKSSEKYPTSVGGLDLTEYHRIKDEHRRKK